MTIIRTKMMYLYSCFRYKTLFNSFFIHII
nr:MAG TPA: hypothetical protein [Herelleviridae sp.]